jgi:hypothetical protein
MTEQCHNDIITLIDELYSPTSHQAFADTGCTGHFLKIDSPCVEKNATTAGINVRLPNGSVITSTHTTLLDFPALPIAARRAHLFPN